MQLLSPVLFAIACGQEHDTNETVSQESRETITSFYKITQFDAMGQTIEQTIQYANAPGTTSTYDLNGSTSTVNVSAVNTKIDVQLLSKSSLLNLCLGNLLSAKIPTSEGLLDTKINLAKQDTIHCGPARMQVSVEQ